MCVVTQPLWHALVVALKKNGMEGKIDECMDKIVFIFFCFYFSGNDGTVVFSESKLRGKSQVQRESLCSAGWATDRAGRPTGWTLRLIPIIFFQSPCSVVNNILCKKFQKRNTNNRVSKNPKIHCRVPGNGTKI